MRLLPSEYAAKVDEVIAEFNQEGQLNIYEPCDCGSHVRHNNGGNYHMIIFLKKDDSGRFFVKYGTTCELVAPPEWEEIADQEAVESIIEKYGDWL